MVAWVKKAKKKNTELKPIRMEKREYNRLQLGFTNGFCFNKSMEAISLQVVAFVCVCVSVRLSARFALDGLKLSKRTEVLTLPVDKQHKYRLSPLGTGCITCHHEEQPGRRVFSLPQCSLTGLSAAWPLSKQWTCCFETALEIKGHDMFMDTGLCRSSKSPLPLRRSVWNAAAVINRMHRLFSRRICAQKLWVVSRPSDRQKRKAPLIWGESCSRHRTFCLFFLLVSFIDDGTVTKRLHNSHHRFPWLVVSQLHNGNLLPSEL